MGYRLLTIVILLLHFGFLAYLVLGGFLAWRWPVTFWAHLVAASWGLAVVVARLTCPLTWAEAWSRQHAGEGAPDRGFIDRYLEGVIYPERYAATVRALVMVVVIVSWVGLLRRHHRTRNG